MTTSLAEFHYDSSSTQLVIPDSRPGHYYVTVRDAGRTGWILGPYPQHQEAIDNVDRGRDLANDANSRACFYSYGTSRVDPSAEPPKSIFGT